MLIAYNSIKLLEQAGYLNLTDEQDNNARVLFLAGKDDLYHLSLGEDQDRLIHLLLRSYTGLFTEPAYISEEVLAKRLEWKKDKLIHALIGLAKERIIQYIPRQKTPFLTFTHEREELSRIRLGKEAYDDRRERYIARAKSVLDYAREELICRNQVLLAYFGEKNTKPCGQCDICLKQKETEVGEEEFNRISARVSELIRGEALTIGQLVRAAGFKEQKTLKVLRFMLDRRQVSLSGDMKLRGNR